MPRGPNGELQPTIEEGYRMLVIDKGNIGIVRVRGYMEKGRPVVEFTADDEPAPRRRFPRPLRRLMNLFTRETIRQIVDRIADSDAVERLLQALGLNRTTTAAP